MGVKSKCYLIILETLPKLVGIATHKILENVKNIVFYIGMAIRQIYEPDSDSYKNPSKKRRIPADSGFLFLADSGFGFRILAIF